MLKPARLFLTKANIGTLANASVTMVSRPSNIDFLSARKKPGYKFLISSCLIGLNCKYNGKNNLNPKIRYFFALRRDYITACPEVMGGLPTPRPPAEIEGGDGEAVLRKKAKVINAAGRDVTEECVRGAAAVARLAKRYGIRQAIFKSNSPCCGVGEIYDGKFTGSLKAGNGILTAALIRCGIKVCSDKEFIIEKKVRRW